MCSCHPARQVRRSATSAGSWRYMWAWRCPHSWPAPGMESPGSQDHRLRERQVVGQWAAGFWKLSNVCLNADNCSTFLCVFHFGYIKKQTAWSSRLSVGVKFIFYSILFYLNINNSPVKQLKPVRCLLKPLINSPEMLWPIILVMCFQSETHVANTIQMILGEVKTAENVSLRH